MRNWDALAGELKSVGATLLVLTYDAPDVLRAAISKKDLRATFVPAVQPSRWADWGVPNPQSPEIPHPSTFVVAPDGMVVLAESHVNYRERSAPTTVIAAIAAHRKR